MFVEVSDEKLVELTVVREKLGKDEGRWVIADAEDVGATGVFERTLGDQTLTFQRDGDKIVDLETNSTWNILGQAIDGPLSGERLSQVVHADHFWFSWAAFRPDTLVYEGE